METSSEKSGFGKTVIITGANGNLGTAVTNHFLSAGYTVIATVINEEAKKDLTPHSNLEVIAVNLMDENEAAKFVDDTIKKHKKIDAALLLVGGFTMGGIAETKMQDIRKQFALNFDTAYQVARPVYLHMKENKKGRIVFIGARPALEASAGKSLVAYALSKSLLFKLAEYINEDAKGMNITATVVAPSTLDTPLNREQMPSADPDKWVKPQALAGILEFIVSDRSTPLRETVLKVYNNS
jgi:NAD(P)-dependent dehydrogenase (short-subunit alcohol dehydrogenase family)